jgi:membrane protein
VGRTLQTVSARASSSGPIGFLVLLLSSVAIFAQLDAAFDRTWRMPTDPHASWVYWVKRLVFKRLKALGMLVGLGGFVVLTMIASMIVRGIEQAIQPQVPIGPWVEWATGLWVNLLLNLFAFTVIYRVVPKAKIGWWEALRGGLLSALLWELGRQALTSYFLHLNYPSAYGIIGSFIAVMLWAFYASVVLLFGAEYVRVLSTEASEAKQTGKA